GRNPESGGGGIRTHGRLAPTTVFKTVPIDHSGTPPSDATPGRESRSLASPGTDLVEDLVGDEDRHVNRDGQGDRGAGPGVDLDKLALVPDPELGEICVLAQLVDVDIL